MKNIYQIAYLTVLAIVLNACGSSEAAEDKKAKLAELKAQKTELEGQISELEKELIASGEMSKKGNSVLVSQIILQPQSFGHKVELRGAVSSRKNVAVAAETMGRIVNIKVKEGDKVSRGQLLIQLDAEVLRNNIDEIETQLELAETIYERQSNLWEKNIGTEVQFLQAKNNKESLERRLATLKSQLKQSNVYAPFSGAIDNIPVRVGEMAQPGMPLVRLVSQDDTYISADVSESYLGKFKEGQELEVYFPAQDKKVISKISALGQVINNENRTFSLEAGLPATNFPVKPNQVVVLSLEDYMTEEALVVPTKIVQKDAKGHYVYELVKEGAGTRANKVYVKPGITYEQRTEILEGLKPGQRVAFEGFRELAQDVMVSISK